MFSKRPASKAREAQGRGGQMGLDCVGGKEEEPGREGGTGRRVAAALDGREGARSPGRGGAPGPTGGVRPHPHLAAETDCCTSDAAGCWPRLQHASAALPHSRSSCRLPCRGKLAATASRTAAAISLSPYAVHASGAANLQANTRTHKRGRGTGTGGQHSSGSAPEQPTGTCGTAHLPPLALHICQSTGIILTQPPLHGAPAHRPSRPV